ncbi:ribonuclease III [bacterium]
MDDRLSYTGEEEGFPNPLGELQERIEVRFEDEANLRAALTHPSFWGEYAIPESERLWRSYERLEFLGDSVVALTVCTYLFEKYSHSHQGHLSKHKGHLVSKKVLLRVAKGLGIGDFIRVGKGVGENTGREHSSFMVDCFEALVGAVYLEFGFDRARDFVLQSMQAELEKNDRPGVHDYKTTFQEVIQKKFKCLPHYTLISETGPEHQKEFTVEVFVNGDFYGEGRGSSKKEAEISAAKHALGKMDLL